MLTKMKKVRMKKIQKSKIFEKRKQVEKRKKEAQGLGALLDKMEDNDHIKLDNIEI